MTSTFDNIQQAVNAASNTAAQVENAYQKTQAAVAKTQEVIAQGQQYYNAVKSWISQLQDILAKLDPYIQPFKNFWLMISNNNEPKRVAIIIGVILVIWLLLKLGNRRGFNQPYDR